MLIHGGVLMIVDKGKFLQVMKKYKNLHPHTKIEAVLKELMDTMSQYIYEYQDQEKEGSEMYVKDIKRLSQLAKSYKDESLDTMYVLGVADLILTNKLEWSASRKVVSFLQIAKYLN